MSSKKNFLHIFQSIVILYTINCSILIPTREVWKGIESDYPKPFINLLNSEYFGPTPIRRWDREVSAIMIHTSKDLSAQEYIQTSWDNQWAIQLLIDKNGIVYGDPYPGAIELPASPGMDPVTIHIGIEGFADRIIQNKIQMEKTIHTIERLVEVYGIKTTNHDISSKEGIFTHNQSKKRFGGFINLKEHGDENLLATILKNLNGKYYPEDQWLDRFESKWVLRKENLNLIKKKFTPDKGRGLSELPKVELKNLEQTSNGFAIEEKRVRYAYKGTIRPTCLVLHYTATSEYNKTLGILEARGLNATIMVDTNGKAYQILDSLYELPSTAYGTNEKCIQIEIVGLNTEELMANQAQSEKVVALVQEISNKFSFPITNHRIEEFKGVYSHTQAKKKFGGSIFLMAQDFDPGEPYMKLVIEKAGGKYFPEKDWYDRQGNNWVILDRKFQP